MLDIIVIGEDEGETVLEEGEYFMANRGKWRYAPLSVMAVVARIPLGPLHYTILILRGWVERFP